MTRVLVASASPVIRAGLEAIVTAAAGLEKAGVIDDLARLARRAEAFGPDVVLLDLPSLEDLPSVLYGWETLLHPPAVVVLTDTLPAAAEAPAPDAPALKALQAGARALLPGDATAREITAAVEAAAAGLVALHPAGIERLLADLGPSSLAAELSPEALTETLTAREVEVLNMLAEGLSNKAIAARLGISEHTVKFHLGAIFGKLGAASRVEAVTMGIRQGLVML
jgi:DNA-binding NarL/FixJ family response regulator